MLLAFKWNPRTNRFGDRRVMAKDFFAQNITQRAPDGDWLIPGKRGRAIWAATKSAKGGEKGIDGRTMRDLPGAVKLEEAEWHALPDGHLAAHFRTRLAPRLMRSIIVDGRVNWTESTFQRSAGGHGPRNPFRATRQPAVACRGSRG